MDEAHVWTDKEIEALERRLKALYNEASADMIAEQERFLEAYAKEKTKLDKQLKDGSINRSEYARKMSAFTASQTLFYETIESLSQAAVSVDKKAYNLINETTPKVFAENYNYGTFQVERGLNIDTSFNLVDESTVKRLKETNPDLLPEWKIDEIKTYEWNKRKFNSAITAGVTSGASLDDVAKEIESVMGMSSSFARTTARTALTSAQNAGRLESLLRMRANGVNVKKEWMATLDKRTRPEHRADDKVVRELEETFPHTGLLYPGDMSTNDPGNVYNCRCTMVANFDEVDYSTGERFSRLDDVSYDEWKAGKGRVSYKGNKRGGRN